MQHEICVFVNFVSGHNRRYVCYFWVPIVDCVQMIKCSVCQDRKKNRVITKCYHMFCDECVSQNLKVNSYGSGPEPCRAVGVFVVCHWSESKLVPSDSIVSAGSIRHQAGCVVGRSSGALAVNSFVKILPVNGDIFPHSLERIYMSGWPCRLAKAGPHGRDHTLLHACQQAWPVVLDDLARNHLYLLYDGAVVAIFFILPCLPRVVSVCGHAPFSFAACRVFCADSKSQVSSMCEAFRTGRRTRTLAHLRMCTLCVCCL